MTDAIERVLEDLHEHTASARLVYLALRDRGGDAAIEIAERIGFTDATVYKALDALEADGWVVGKTVQQECGGRNPVRYAPLLPCPDCGERFQGGQGLATHRSRCDDERIHADDIKGLDATDVGLDDDVPEPSRGVQ